MKLVLAQGNPEARFDGTRHNIGFHIISALAHRVGADWQEKTKFRAYVAETTIVGEKVLLVKPTTFYNETGQSARAIVDFYKLDPSQDVLVIHDDLALPLGLIRVRPDGGDAGNNGIKSLNAHLGPDYHRLRIGVMSDQHHNDLDFVLGTFNEQEREALKPVIDQAISLTEQFAAGELEITSHTL